MRPTYFAAAAAALLLAGTVHAQTPGIATSCDEFQKRYEACAGNASPEMRAMIELLIKHSRAAEVELARARKELHELAKVRPDLSHLADQLGEVGQVCANHIKQYFPGPDCGLLKPRM